MAQAPSTDGLVAYWKFDESSGTTANDTAGIYNATLNSGASFAPDQGQSGGALKLNALTGGATVPSFDLSGSAITISAWVKANPTTSGANRRVLGKTNPANSNDYSFILNVTSQEAVEMKFMLNGSTANASTRGRAIVEGQWHHIAATYDGSEIVIYVDGASETTSKQSGTLVNTANMKLGIGNRPQGAASDHPFDGLIDELRVYDRSLSASEVSNLTTPQAYRQLPVTFLSFRAAATSAGVQLDWAVADQQDNAGFTVERSRDRQEGFGDVGFVPAHQSGDYRFVEYSAPTGTLYYRLRQEDYDGTISYSDLVTVRGEEATGLSIFPNPASSYVTLRGSGTYRIVDAMGRRVATGSIADQQSIPVADLPAGTYTMLCAGEQARFVKR
ncbi:LamG-like jellyroll fold domain-containing protein [Neolewinella litorea]|nr:LamG-like jellyroll fold domain-containing protein [Neolewinella litorea]